MRIRMHDGVELHVLTAGDPAAQPVLFFHGFPMSGGMWSRAAEGLADRFFCIVPDLRGHGASDPPPSADAVEIATYADDGAAVLRHAARDRPAVICGLSMGGIVTLEFLRRHGDLARALVLCCTRANPETPEGITTREQRARLALDRGAEGVRQVADAMIGTILAPGADDGVRDAVYGMMLATSPVGFAAASRALGARPDSRPTLPRIRIPTLLVAGEEDTITPPELMRDMHRAIPGSRFVDIPGAGHMPPMEKPDEFNTVLRAFLERL